MYIHNCVGDGNMHFFLFFLLVLACTTAWSSYLTSQHGYYLWNTATSAKVAQAFLGYTGEVRAIPSAHQGAKHHLGMFLMNWNQGNHKRSH